MPRTSEALARTTTTTTTAEALLGTLDVDHRHPENISDLRHIGDALQTVAAGEAELARAVAERFGTPASV